MHGMRRNWGERPLQCQMDEIVRAVSYILGPGRGETILLPESFSRWLLPAIDEPPDPIALIEEAEGWDARGYRSVLSHSGRKHLRTSRFADVRDVAINSQCPIHQLDFEDTDTVTLLPCLHCFTPSAIERWLTNERAECPVCRHALPSVEVPDPGGA